GAVDLLSKLSLQGTSLVGAIRHAIQLKRIEASLDEAQTLAQLGSWEVDLETNSVTWSPEMYRMLGFGFDQKPGYDELVERIHPDDRAATAAALRAAVEEFT